ncbi:hypothetical protein [Hyphomicrobium sp.]|uniref:hypothetical protein n=1 Tax=Hyphomicrobium sp. TaxID=82 RepID=UPI002E34168B|nr:hypothetical protein [Hyphomicrobium sp.]HEX2842052.1 hypothetical protein [Hyphomicrobium sp.]
MRARGSILAGICFGLGFTHGAAALEYCVTCEGPPAMYRCIVAGTEDGPGKDPTVSLYCISQMAKQGRHASCAVSKGAPFPCPGLTAIIEAKTHPALASPPADSPPVDAAATTEPAHGAAPHPQETAKPTAEQPTKVPRTMEELAGQTVKSSQEGLQKAGETIGGTAKKAGEQIGHAGNAIGNAASQTWTCITSLFSSCSGNEAEAEPPPGEPHRN